MELRYQQKWSIIGTKLVVLWLTAVGALTPHFVVETSAIDNAKAPNIIICTRYTVHVVGLLMFLLWLLLSLFVCLFFCAFFVLYCRPVSSKHFIINLQLIWAEMIPVSWSNPEIIVTIGTGVRVTVKVRIGISSRIVRNIHIMAPTKGWTITIIAVSGAAIVAVSYVLFEVSIPVVVLQWV